MISLRRNQLCRRSVNAKKQRNIMGDKSPKSNQKKSKQQTSKANTAAEKKKQEVFAKQSGNKK